ncbi:MAG TPA: M1 family aminopeptidase, partial [Verrucomicrobiae bacterium]|nr:M1 family aminopeptidase [Verrucomicrobiae bacterium]
ASNERITPWMDEGINSYYEQQYEQYKNGKSYHEEEVLFQTLVEKHEDQPIASTAEEFTPENYGLVAYYKTSQWIRLLEQSLGAERFRSLMQQYYQQWKFKHPQPQDFKNIFYPALEGKGDKFFKLLNERGPLPTKRALGVSILSPLKPSSVSNYVQSPTKSALWLSPAFGYNYYDKLMVGGLVSNYKLPPSPLQFVGIPLYATGSKKLTGIGKVSYSTFSANKLHKTEVFLNGAAFTYNDFTDGTGQKHTARFTKLVPGAELTFTPSDPHATTKTFVQWKSYFIGEQPFRFSFDSTFANGDTIVNEVVSTQKLNYAIHQLKLGIENNRALYPYAAAFTAQGSQYFLRLMFEGNYFFNYREGGLHVRLFGGKFFYDENEKYPYGYYIDRFALNMSGPNGEEDYTYSNYFVGRSEFEGLASRQLVERDGGFKIRTDLLANKVGKTGDWLMAANFNTTIPDRLNPFSVLPIKIPLRLFADIGTYAEAWDRDAESDRFLFDAGFHIPLFGELINFYFPVVYSPVFKDYVKSTYEKNRLFKTMTFSINLDKTFKQLERAASF